ncbi:translation elongation factor Ts [Candidatus Blochmanniella vafra str. BVAF]|uniref:Elongation factor Ts n=1 Tax=Blochmanniella vafra (strain BVAF) TaxID=859654 RepID=E8Q6S6_BLOVB|nr:translation elongation factor Ts [Candidatus Blochmannia vafer]ADV33673.1 translation elongation factor Ts [Candidatus Blochmannia vafer str. BVAF]
MNIINSDLIKELRRRTNVSIMKCKQALEESNGDVELAIDNIKKSGLKIDSIKSNRLTVSGLIVSKISSNKQIGLMIEINCETDFVARNSLFQEFTNTVINTALSESIININILKTRFENQRCVLMNTVGENIEINKFIVLTGDFLCSYVHNAKIGVIVDIIFEKTINILVAKNIAMHIAASSPKYIYENDVPEEIMLKEYRTQMNLAIKSGKSLKIAEKITQGRINKFMNQIVLTKQNFIMEMNRTVGSILDENHIKIKNFIRFEIGYDN